MGSVAEDLALIGMLIGIMLIAIGVLPTTLPTANAVLRTTVLKPLLAWSILDIGLGAFIFMASAIAYALARERGIDL